MNIFSRVIFIVSVFGFVGCGSDSGTTNSDDQADSSVEDAEIDVINDANDTGATETNEPDTTPEPDVEPEPVELEYFCSSNEVELGNPYSQMFPGDQFEMEFEIPEGTFSFQLVTYYDEGRTHVFDRMTTPDGQTINFITQEYMIFHASLQLSGGEVDTLLFPSSPAQAAYVMPGTYTLRGISDVYYNEFCYRVLINPEPGNEIELNFYLLEGSEVNATDAPNDADWNEVLDELASTYEQIGVTVNTENANYFDITGAEATAHLVIEGQEEINDLFKLSQEPEYDPLRLNVFLISSFSGDMEGVLGVSGGIPGSPGLHGGPISGVVFATEGLLGQSSIFMNGNELLGQTMAHEIGHYLGLFHTSEMQGDQTDPINDTPSCPSATISSREMQSCPDYDNLMFPTASMRDSVVITDQQSEILRGQPNVQP